MPEMLMRYLHPGQRERALEMVQAAQIVAEKLFGKEVVWEARQFGDTEGQSDFALVTTVTDNDDSLVDVSLQVQSEVLNTMSSLADPNETVEHWVQRVKGKWSSATGTRPVT